MGASGCWVLVRVVPEYNGLIIGILRMLLPRLIGLLEGKVGVVRASYGEMIDNILLNVDGLMFPSSALRPLSLSLTPLPPSE